MEFDASSLDALGTAVSLAFLALLAPLLLWAAVSDARRGIIPDACNALIAALGLLFAAALGGPPLALAGRLVDAALVGALLLALRAVYRRRRGTSGLGLGDVKLLAASTLWLGLSGLFLALLLASLAALAQAGAMALAGRRIEGGTRLRFGPHLALAVGLVLLFDAVAYPFP